MPKIVYANVVWLLILLAGFINASFVRHQSEFWAKIPDALSNYDFLFLGFFGSLFLASVSGLLMRKRWGFELTMGSNYLIAFLFLFPLPFSLYIRFKYGIPPAEISAENWYSLTNLIGFVISLVIIVLMKKSDVKSLLSPDR